MYRHLRPAQSRSALAENGGRIINGHFRCDRRDATRHGVSSRSIPGPLFRGELTAGSDFRLSQAARPLRPVLVSTEKPVDIGDLAFCPSLVDYVGDRGAGMRAWRTRPAMPEGSASCAGSPGLFLFAVLLRQMPFDVHGVVQDTADPDQLRADYAIKEEMAR